MKTALRILMFGSALAMSVGGIAHAQATRAGSMTCRQFLALDDVSKPKVVFWAEGVSKSGQAQNAVIDVQRVNRIVPVLITQCTQNPNASFWNSLKSSEQNAGAQ